MRKEVTVPTGARDPGNPGESRLLLYEGAGKGMFGNHLLRGGISWYSLPDMRITMTIMAGDRCDDQAVVSLGMRAWVTLPVSYLEKQRCWPRVRESRMNYRAGEMGESLAVSRSGVVMVVFPLIFL